MPAILIADSGSTKCEWCLLENGKKKTVLTPAMSPYFVSGDEMIQILNKQLMPKIKNTKVDELHFYGTGLGNPANVVIMKKVFKQLFPKTKTEINTDLLGIARASCGKNKGIACILGTGSNACFYNGKKIVNISPGLGYVLGDEGSGAYLGKKVIQYYLYNTFDEDLRYKFDLKYNTDKVTILEQVYKQPLPNRYLASFALFLTENRGHYMVENIIEDGLNDFFFTHLCKFGESWKYPINFVGGVAYGFKDKIIELCESYEFEFGQILKNPMEGLIRFHK